MLSRKSPFTSCFNDDKQFTVGALQTASGLNYHLWNDLVPTSCFSSFFWQPSSSGLLFTGFLMLFDAPSSTRDQHYGFKKICLSGKTRFGDAAHLTPLLQSHPPGDRGFYRVLHRQIKKKERNYQEHDAGMKSASSYQRSKIAPAVRPAPKASKRIVWPDWMRPSRMASSSTVGIVAAEVFP